MNKSELIEELSLRLDLPQKKSESVVNAIFNSLIDAMKQGRRIEIRGFGSFCVREYSAYKGRDPRTGNTVQVKPKNEPLPIVKTENVVA